jgi:hypothetical protein
MALTLKIRDGLTENVYYPDLTANLAALTASYNGQRSLADQIASLEAQLKTARIAQVAESANARDILKSSARACESADPSDEALASVGWDLRKGRSPSQLLPAPSKLTLRPTGFLGEMIARWGRVPNFRFYELQAAVIGRPECRPGLGPHPHPQHHQRLRHHAPHPRRQNHGCPRPHRQSQGPQPLERRRRLPRAVIRCFLYPNRPSPINRTKPTDPAVRLRPGGGVFISSDHHATA